MIREEQLRAAKLFHKVTVSKVYEECKEELVENHIALLQTECRQVTPYTNRRYNITSPIMLIYMHQSAFRINSCATVLKFRGTRKS